MTDRENHEREDHEQAETPTSGSPSRRQFIAGGAALGLRGPRRPEPGAADIGAGAAARQGARRIHGERASLSDVKHVVILMQENRSFDHYFGSLSGVRGFSDPNVPSRPSAG